METYKTKAKVKKDHKVHIEDVPFDDGQEVDIVISLSNESEHPDDLKKSLLGSVLKYNDPFKPVITSDDWELLK